MFKRLGLALALLLMPALAGAQTTITFPPILNEYGSVVATQKTYLLNGNGSLIGSGNPLSVACSNCSGGGSSADPANAPFQGSTALTVGVTATAARSILFNCTAAGNVSLIFANASTLTVPAQIGLTILPFAITQVSSQTATCTFANLS